MSSPAERLASLEARVDGMEKELQKIGDTLAAVSSRQNKWSGALLVAVLFVSPAVGAWVTWVVKNSPPVVAIGP
jgi:hypothetical protein